MTVYEQRFFELNEQEVRLKRDEVILLTSIAVSLNALINKDNSSELPKELKVLSERYLKR